MALQQGQLPYGIAFLEGSKVIFPYPLRRLESLTRIPFLRDSMNAKGAGERYRLVCLVVV
ncbi:hypothetical protein A9R05_09865 [Burkholderia sp. KK1]|nr:hypothetical protein A9R05_09865 [Burkholderia sp. KK1]